MSLACLVLALQPVVSASTPPLDAAAALKLLQGSTSFGARSGRSKLRIARLEPVEEAEKHRWYLVAMEWTAVGTPPEGDRAEIGVAMVKRLDDVDVDERVYGLDGGWAVVDLLVGTKLESLLAGTEGARAKADETSALGHLREMASAQMAFAGQAGGAYAAEGRCLTEPATCLDGYSGPPFLTAPVDESWGYRFTIQGKKPSGLKPGLAATFVLTAVPVAASEDKRSFCADAARSCVLRAGVDPGDTACPASCSAIE